MFLESLIRLAQTIDELEKNGSFLISKKFHEETVELIKSQTNFLIEELKFKESNPGPYDYGFGDLTISLFSPDHTGEQEWAAIARKGTWQKNYRFNSIMGLVKILSLIVEDSNTTEDE